MTTDIRTPSEEDRAQVVDVLRTSLNFTRAWADERGPTMPLAGLSMRLRGRSDRRTAAAGYRFRQWFGGRDLPMSGIYAVATLPEHRGQRAWRSAAVLQVLRDARDAGSVGERALSGGPPPVSLDRLRAGRDVQRASPRPGRDPVRPGRRPARRRAARPRARPGRASGLLPGVDRDTATARSSRPTTRGGRDGSCARSARRSRARWWSAATTDRSRGSPRSATPTPRAGTWTSTSDWNAWRSPRSSDRAIRALLAYFRSFRGVGIWVQWCGPPEDPIAMLLPEQDIATPFRYRWMFRLLDVRSALAATRLPGDRRRRRRRGRRPAVPGERRAVAVDRSRRRARASSRRRDAGVRPLSIGILSSLFTGFLRCPTRSVSGTWTRRPRRRRRCSSSWQAPTPGVRSSSSRRVDGRAMTVTVRAARPEDWSAVAALLVELGRGVAAGTAEDPTHRMQFGGHLRRLDSVTLVAEVDGEVVGRRRHGVPPASGRPSPAGARERPGRDRASRGAPAWAPSCSARAEALARKRGCFRMALVTAELARRDDRVLRA